MTAYEKISKKLQEGKIVYLLSEYEEIAMQLDPKKSKATMKPKGLPAYQADDKTKIVNDILLEANEISEAEYKKY